MDASVVSGVVAWRKHAVGKELGGSGVLGVGTQQQQCEVMELVFAGALAKQLEQWALIGGVGDSVGVFEGAASICSLSSSMSSSDAEVPDSSSSRLFS